MFPKRKKSKFVVLQSVAMIECKERDNKESDHNITLRIHDINRDPKKNTFKNIFFLVVLITLTFATLKLVFIHITDVSHICDE